MEIGLLIVRVVVGALLVGHGSQKLFGWFGGYGLKGTGGYMESFGLRPGPLFAFAAGAAELTGGLAFGTGLLTPVAAAIVASTMLVASRTDHAGKGLWIYNGGFEYRPHQRRGRHRLRLRGRRPVVARPRDRLGRRRHVVGPRREPSWPCSAGAACSPCGGSASPPRARRSPRDDSLRPGWRSTPARRP